MPSAEKVLAEAPKIESAVLDEQKTSENAQKENEISNNGEKSLCSISPIQQALQIIQNKVRNLEKRKVCKENSFNSLSIYIGI